MCIQDSTCLTLSQFAINSSKYQGNDTDISLIFLPGDHTLDTELSLTYADNYSLTTYMYPQGNETVFVKCISQSGKFNVSETAFVLIEHLHFIGCGENTLTHVKQFLLIDAIFQGVDSRGRALILKNVSNASIISATFTHGSDEVDSRCGGALHISQSLFYIINATFIENTASCGGVLGVTNNCTFKIINSSFMNNNAEHYGTMFVLNSTFAIINCTFVNNSATGDGGVMVTIMSLFRITFCKFVNNNATNSGVIGSVSRSFFIIENSTFANNSAAASGGVIATYNSAFYIYSSNFTNNYANFSGGVMITYESSFSAIDSNFIDNSAYKGGGVTVALVQSSISITKCIFTNNSANFNGGVGVLYIQSSYFNSATTVTISDSVFSYNKAYFDGIVFISGSLVLIANSNFSHNLGSLTAYSSNITFIGHNKFEHQGEQMQSNTEVPPQQGGAVTSFKSNVIFTGVSEFSNNQAIHGGAIRATESTITVYGKTTISNNSVTNSDGGGIYLQQSLLEIKGSCTISNNYAARGGEIHAKSSTITVYKPGSVQFVQNNADKGGGIYLEADSYLSILLSYVGTETLFTFTDNHANCGGALYVADDTNSASCSPNFSCFFQILGFVGPENTDVSMLFSGNTATYRGSNLFGGLLDRCNSQYTYGYVTETANVTGISDLKDISNINLDSIHSLPVQVCFCTSKGELDCSYQPPPIRVKKGERFTLSLAALDQVHHPVDANVSSFLAFPNGGFDEGQQIQKVNSNCTDIAFTVFSPEDKEKVTLYADGPCGSNSLFVRQVDIKFLKCTCWVGFKPSARSSTRCECICDSALSPYITKCNYTTKSLLRDTNSWIAYINDTDPPGFLISPNCPFDYCYSQAEKIHFSLPTEVDKQCAYNRMGVLCGTCQKNLSLSLGSSHCLPCPSHWPAVFIAIVLASIIAGVLLVTVLLILNITVANGVINGIIFYANIVAANSGTVFPSTEPSFPTVFVAWLNLDVGFDVCFFHGLDTYTKTWLQLAFPVYITLIIVLIKISDYSQRFTNLLGPGKRDTIATLSTLTLLSYTKLLSTTIAILSFSVFLYPNGSKLVVWLPDGNLKYGQEKHIALIVAALLIVLVGVPYTLLLFFWQWLIQTPEGKLFKWTKDTKLNAVITTYHVPYNYKHRYWTGLLMLVRVVLYITAAVTNSGNPQLPLLMTVILIGGLFFLKSIIGIRLYKSILVDIMETVTFINILTFAAFTLYNFKADSTRQMAIAYVSTSITFFILMGELFYHVYLLIKRRRRRNTAEDEHDLLPLEENWRPRSPPEETNSDHSVVAANTNKDFNSAPCVAVHEVGLEDEIKCQVTT